MKRKLKIALMGTRGVPANYGGFETCVQEVGRRLVEYGHDVTVYCRGSYYKNRSSVYLGMKLIHLPNIPHKSLDTLSHTFLCCIHAIFQTYDIHMVFNAANSLFVFPLRLIGKVIVINTDGLEWKRSKWGFLGKTFYKLSEKFACLIANRLISDSEGIRDYYKKKHNVNSNQIAYGAEVYHVARPNRLYSLGVAPGEYFLQITRFEPENHPLLTMQAFNRLRTTKKLIIVGGNPYPNDYTKKIATELKENILLPGFIYDSELLKELWCFAYAYIHGNSVGGTNPALLQTMASGCFTLAIDNVFNRDVLSDCGIYYQNDIHSLKEKMKWTLENHENLEAYKQRAQERILANYSWEEVAAQYEDLFFEIANGKYSWSLRSFFG